MYERVKLLYEQGRLTQVGVERAVRLGWITEQQKKEILEERK